MGFTKQELEEALRAVSSLLSKLRKVEAKLTPGTSQHTLARNRIAALRVSKALIQADLKAGSRRRRPVTRAKQDRSTRRRS